jgi:hypothetical protein
MTRIARIDKDGVMVKTGRLPVGTLIPQRLVEDYAGVCLACRRATYGTAAMDEAPQVCPGCGEEQVVPVESPRAGLVIEG